VIIIIKMYHKPVLLERSINGLEIKSDGVYVDVTFGGGGHSKVILEKLSNKGKLIAFDHDEDAMSNRLNDNRILFISSNFRYLNRFLKLNGINKVDGILADFGVSSHQFDSKERGFSTRFNGPLDMRMDKTQTLSAFNIINEYSVEDLVKLFKDYGELRNSKQLAAVIGVQRSIAPILTTAELRRVVESILPDRFLNKALAQLFQALRIEVNDELEVIKDFLIQTPHSLYPGGRLVCISYHSLEDRLVKRFIREGKFQGEADKDVYGNTNLPFKKIGGVQVPSSDEIIKNNRSRSAKLRIAEKV
jgi:16S rRNA (cytosine1402-N4)-methyltransferase